MEDDQIKWVGLRIWIPENMHKDLKIIKKSNGSTMSKFIRPILRNAIEDKSKLLPVGSNRKKED